MQKNIIMYITIVKFSVSIDLFSSILMTSHKQMKKRLHETNSLWKTVIPQENIAKTSTPDEQTLFPVSLDVFTSLTVLHKKPTLLLS